MKIASSKAPSLLKQAPIKNKIFKKLQKQLQDFTAESGWETANASALALLDLVDSKRSQLEPAFNEDDSTILVLTKAELGEVHIEEFRNRIVKLYNATQWQNITEVMMVKKQAVLALSEVGELLVET